MPNDFVCCASELECIFNIIGATEVLQVLQMRTSRPETIGRIRAQFVISDIPL